MSRILHGTLKLHGVDAEKLCRRVVRDAGLDLSWHKQEELLARRRPNGARRTRTATTRPAVRAIANRPVLERLAKGVERRPRELREFVEEEHAVVRERPRMSAEREPEHSPP